MAIFFYKGYTSSGKPTEGSIESSTRQQASKTLISRGIRPTSVSEESAEKKTSLLDSIRGVSKKSFTKKTKNLAETFLSKVLQLHKSGMPVGDVIKTLKDRLREQDQKELANRIWQDLSEGITLAGSMKRFPDIFDNSIIFAIEAGEASGNLAPIMENIVESLRAQAEIKRKIYSGLAYPIFVSVVAFGVVGLFLFYLLPRIQNMMQSLGGEMTISARILIGSAEIALRYGPFLVIGAIIALFVIANWRRKTSKGRRTTDEWFLKIPFLGTLIRQTTYSQTANLLATLLHSGVNTTEAMRLTEKLINNTILRERFHIAQKQINDGAAISNSFRVNRFYPDIAIDILTVGENTGNMAVSFREIYKIYSSELGANLQRLTTIISTAALIFAFVLVAILAISIVTSVLQFSNSLVQRNY